VHDKNYNNYFKEERFKHLIKENKNNIFNRVSFNSLRPWAKHLTAIYSFEKSKVIGPIFIQVSFFFFFFWLCLWYTKVPGPGIKPTAQQ